MRLSAQQLRYLGATGFFKNLGRRAVGAGRAASGHIGRNRGLYTAGGTGAVVVAGLHAPRIIGKVVDAVEKSTAAAVGDVLLDNLRENELREPLKKGADRQKEVVESLQRALGKGGKSLSRIIARAEHKALRSLRKTPGLRPAVRVAAGIGTKAGEISTRLIKGVVKSTEESPTVSKARDLATILSQDVLGFKLRDVGRDIRRSPTLRQIGKFLTGSTSGRAGSTKLKIKPSDVVAWPAEMEVTQGLKGGLGFRGSEKKRYGVAQKFRQFFADKPDSVQDTNKVIRERLKARAEARAGYVEKMAAVRKELNRAGLVKGTVAYNDAYARARNQARNEFSEKLSEANTIFRVTVSPESSTRKFGGRRIPFTNTGNIGEPFTRRHRGAKVDLGATAAFGLAGGYVGTKQVKASIDKIKAAKNLRARRKEDRGIEEGIRLALELEYPELDRYDRENLVQSRLRLHQRTRAEAAARVSVHDALMANLGTIPETPQSKKPKESSLASLKTQARKLKKVLTPKKRSSKRRR